MPKLTYRLFSKTKRGRKSSSFLLQFYIISCILHYYNYDIVWLHSCLNL